MENIWRLWNAFLKKDQQHTAEKPTINFVIGCMKLVLMSHRTQLEDTEVRSVYATEGDKYDCIAYLCIPQI